MLPASWSTRTPLVLRKGFSVDRFYSLLKNLAPSFKNIFCLWKVLFHLDIVSFELNVHKSNIIRPSIVRSSNRESTGIYFRIGGSQHQVYTTCLASNNFQVYIKNTILFLKSDFVRAKYRRQLNWKHYIMDNEFRYIHSFHPVRRWLQHRLSNTHS